MCNVCIHIHTSINMCWALRMVTGLSQASAPTLLLLLVIVCVCVCVHLLFWTVLRWRVGIGIAIGIGIGPDWDWFASVCMSACGMHSLLHVCLCEPV